MLPSIGNSGALQSLLRRKVGENPPFRTGGELAASLILFVVGGRHLSCGNLLFKNGTREKKGVASGEMKLFLLPNFYEREGEVFPVKEVEGNPLLSC